MPSHQLRTFSLTMIVIGLVIGLGIFRTARDVAGAALTPELFFAAWIAGGIFSICGGLCFAEIGSRLPVTGGYYALFSYAYHPAIAFGINCVILVSNAASLAGVALIGSEYLMEILLPGHGASAWIALFSILLFFVVNLAGLQYSSRVLNFLMIIKIAVLLIIIAAIFIVPERSQGAAAAGATASLTTGWTALLISFGLALKGACFAYGGYQQTINFGGEVANPTRTIPRSIITGLLVVIVLYLLVNLSYYHIIGFQSLKTSSAIVSIIAGQLFGPVGALFTAAVLFLAVLAYVNVSLLSNPRVMAAMSADKILPASFGKRHKGNGVFRVSLSVFTAIACIVLFFAEGFGSILSFSIFLDSVGMVGAGIALFLFRRRQERSDTNIYRARPYPLVPLVFIAGYAFVASVIAIQEPLYALTGTVVLLVFLTVYYVTRRSSA